MLSLPNAWFWLRRHMSGGRLAQFMLLLVILVSVQQTIIKKAHAASPTNLASDIEWDEDPLLPGNQKTLTSIEAIEAAFTHARRQEELQLGLSVGALGELTLPGDWAQLTMEQKAVILINAERHVRADGTVIRVPLAGVDSRLTTIAQGYADHLLQTNTWGHAQDGTPTDRLNARFGDPQSEPTVACQEFLARTEALSAFWSTRQGPIAAIIEQAVYAWLYRDSRSKWGHRETILLQDTLPDGSKGYQNNVGSAAHEGFLGVGHAAGAGYDPLDWGWPQWGEVIVLNLIDPSTNPDCSAGNTSSAITVDKVTTRPNSPAAGEIFTVTYSLTNSGSTLLTGLNLTDTFDVKNLQFVSATPSATVDTNAGTISWQAIETTIDGRTLSPAETMTIIVTLVKVNERLLNRDSTLPMLVAEDGWENVIIGVQPEEVLPLLQLYLPTVRR